MTRANLISIIIPTFNEAERLPLLLADLKRWPEPLDINLVDCGSSDSTKLVGEINGAKVLSVSSPNRGLQLAHGARKAKGDWLLFLHADSRLSDNWATLISSIVKQKRITKKAYFFNLKVSRAGIGFRLLELFVLIRSNYFKRPYGDQGLLITKSLYNEAGGYASLKLMEDIDLIERITTIAKVKSLGLAIYTDKRRWEKKGLIWTSWKNFQLRRRWKNGEKASVLFKEYYH